MTKHLPPEGAGQYVHYQHLRIGGAGWQRRDVGPIVHAHQDQWLDELDQWHRTVSRQAAGRTRWWWLVAGSRMTAWYPFDLRPLLFALAVIELCRSGEIGPTLHLVGLPEESIAYLREWAAASSGPTITVRGGGRTRRLKRGTLAFISAWGFVTVGLMGSLIARLLLKARTKPANQSQTLVVSLTLSVDVMKQVGDHYFGRAFDEPSARTPGGIQWFYLLSRFEERRSVRAYCDAIGRPIRFDFESLGWQDLIPIFRDAVTVGKRLRGIARTLPVFKVGGLVSETFPSRFATVAMARAAPVRELGVYYGFKRHLQQVRPAAVVYPYEEKGIERAILAACAEHDSPIRTVAFAHAALNRGHLYVRRQDELKRPRAAVIATTGPAVRRWLIHWAAVPPERLTVVGSPRFVPLVQDPVARKPGAPLRVLFLGGYGYEIGHLATLAEDLPDLFEGAEVLIRQYPHGWIAEQEAGLNRLRDLGVSFRSSQDGLASQIRWADVVLFGSTSAGIESMLSGRIGIRIMGDVFDANSTDGKDDENAVPQCRTARDLKTWLTAVERMDPISYGRMADRQRCVAAHIYAPFDITAVRACLSGDPDDAAA